MCSSSIITEAKSLHRLYLKKNIRWFKWLLPSSGPPTGLYITLHRLVHRFIEMRESGGAFDKAILHWTQVKNNSSSTDEEIELAEQILSSIPSLAEMKSAIGFEDPKSNYKKFEAEYSTLRVDVELAARRYIHTIESSEFLDKFRLLPEEERMQLSSELIEGLSASNIGLSYLIYLAENYIPPDSSNIGNYDSETQNNLPALHPDRFLRSSLDFDISSNNTRRIEAIRRTSQAFFRLHYEFIPAFRNVSIGKHSVAALHFTWRFYSKVTFGNTNFKNRILSAIDDYTAQRIHDTIIKTEDILIRSQDYLNNVPVIRQRIGIGVASSFSFVIETINLLNAIEKIINESSFVNGIALADALVSISEGLHITLERGGKFFFRNNKFSLPGKVPLGYLAVFTAIADMVQSLQNSGDAWNRGDDSVAIAETARAVGFGAIAVAGIWTVLEGASATGPYAPYVALGGAAIVLVGSAVIYYTTNPRLEDLLLNNFFGSNWDRTNTNFPNPDSILFNFFYLNGEPNLPRQISAFISILYPINVKSIIYIEPNPPYEPMIQVDLEKPTFVSKNSEITIKEIEIKSEVPKTYEVSEILHIPMFNNFEELEDIKNEFDAIILHTPNPYNGNISLESWSITFPSKLLKSSGSPLNKYLEVDILDNDLIRSTYYSQGDTDFHPDLVPLAMRQRRQITKI